MKVTGIEETILYLRTAVATKTKEALIRDTTVAVNKLKDNTPVDTGEARDGWGSRIEGNKGVIFNDVSHIAALNGGSSQQAPAHFVERTLLEDFEPNGSIVTYR